MCHLIYYTSYGKDKMPDFAKLLITFLEQILYNSFIQANVRFNSTYETKVTLKSPFWHVKHNI